MTMRKKIGVAVAICLILTILTPTAMAAGETPAKVVRIRGPWVSPGEELDLSMLYQPEQLVTDLQRFEQLANGRMKLETVGYSANYQYPIQVAKFGERDDTKPKLLIDSQIHGNEPLGTEALMRLIEAFATSDDPEIKMILDNVVVWFIPMLNPDGSVFFQTETNKGDNQQRHNIQEWTPARWGLPAEAPAPWYHREATTKGTPGYDINRDSHPHLFFDLNRLKDEHSPTVEEQNWGGEPGFFVTPEARALRDAFLALEPDAYINHHHRGNNIVSPEDTSRVYLQICAQFVPAGREFKIKDGDQEYVYTLSEESLDLSRKMNALVYQKLQPEYTLVEKIAQYTDPMSIITKYRRVDDDNDGAGLPGTTLGSYSLNGAAVMLYEVSNLGPKMSEELIKQSLTGIYETIKAFATGEIYDVDPDFYEYEIPESGPAVRDPYYSIAS
ncbi:MAG TPA: M14 family zinc carboxypeptidase [bacterium]|nr:M14 family zinc carboxypeptidase [bacterium]